jgi:hypothetical protein
MTMVNTHEQLNQLLSEIIDTKKRAPEEFDACMNTPKANVFLEEVLKSRPNLYHGLSPEEDNNESSEGFGKMLEVKSVFFYFCSPLKHYLDKGPYIN